MDGVLRVSSCLLLASAAIFVLGRCSDGPEQQPNLTPAVTAPPKTAERGPQPKIDIPIDFGNGATDTSTGRDEDAITRKNAREPIVYGVGAAGITFSTLFNDGQKTLSKPLAGPFDDGQTIYSSGLVLWWRPQAPRTPDAMLLTADYLGKLEIGGTFGTWQMNQDLTSYFPTNDAQGERFLVELFNTLEKRDSSYNCIQDGVCNITGWDNPTQENVVFDMPKLALLVSKDRKNLFRILLRNIEPKGQLHNDLDLATGVINGGASVGQTWAEILLANAEDGKTDPHYNSMQKRYDGVVLSFSKSSFDRSYKTDLLPTETLFSIGVFGNYPNNLRLGGRLIDISGLPAVVATAGEPVDGKKYFNLKNEIPARLQLGFATAFVDLVKREIGQKGATVTALTGTHKASGPKTYSGYVVNYDSDANSGRSVIFELSEETRHLAYIEVGAIVQEADKRIIPAVAKGFALDSNSYSGFSIGEKVKVSEIDLGRDEATVTFADGKQQRALYSRKVAFEKTNSEGRVTVENETRVAFGTLRVSLGLKANPEGDFEITAIGTGLSRVSGLCGIASLEVGPGDGDRDFLKRLTDEVAKQKAKDKKFDCRYSYKTDSGDANRIDVIFFPDQNIKLDWSEREFYSATLYGKVTSPQQAPNEGGQP